MRCAEHEPSTVAAIATAPGPAAIGVLRLSGPASHELLRALVPAVGRVPAERRFVTGWAVDPDTGERIDRVMAVAFPAGGSYTGEAAAEIHGHGGALVLERLLEAALRAGARAAPPGEFTRRAFLNGRLDLVQAEAVAQLVSAQGTRAARASLDQLSGGLSRSLEDARRPLVEALALVEASLDFPDEEVPDPGEQVLAAHIDSARRRLVELAGTWRRARRIFEGVRVVLAGPPNSGKSSLFNRILGRERALIDEQPGTTRDYLESSVETQGTLVTLVDTAGLRGGAGRVEAQGIEMSLEALAGADVVVLVVDGTGIAAGALGRLRSAARQVPIVVAVNKIDLGRTRDRESTSLLAPFERHLVSARTGEGVGALLDALAGGRADEANAATAMITQVRHRDLVERAAGELEGCLEDLAADVPPDLLAVRIRLATAHIDAITGREVGPEVLDEIFARFCIGK